MRKQDLQVTGAALLSLTMWFACSNSGSGPLSTESFAEQYTAAYCDLLQPCCEQDGHPYDDAYCRSSTKYGVPPEGLSLAYDEAAAAQCLRELRSAKDSCGRPDYSVDSACYRVFQPTLELGEPCQSGAECRTADANNPPWCLAIAPGGATVCFVPGAPLRARAGEACGQSCSTYGTSEFCSYVFTTNAACHREDGLYCSEATGTCVAFADAGMPCDGFSTPCRDDLFCKTSCDPATGVCPDEGICQSRGGQGEPCDIDDFASCLEAGQCREVDCPPGVASSRAGQGCRDICVIPAKEGERCTQADYAIDACTYPSFCDPQTTTCVPPRRLGEPCSDAEWCDADLFCAAESQRCESRRAVGEPCAERIECASIRCSADPETDPVQSHGAQSSGSGSCLPAQRTRAFECSDQPIATPNPSPTGGAT